MTRMREIAWLIIVGIAIVDILMVISMLIAEENIRSNRRS